MQTLQTCKICKRDDAAEVAARFKADGANAGQGGQGKVRAASGVMLRARLNSSSCKCLRC
jgi:hypothetical protein